MVEITEGKPLHFERLSSRWNGTAQSLSATNTEGGRVAEGARRKVSGNKSKRVVYIDRGNKIRSAKYLAPADIKACSHVTHDKIFRKRIYTGMSEHVGSQMPL